MTTHETTDGDREATARTDDGEWRIILNPVSGSGDHAERVESLAAERGYTVERTEGSGDAIEFARRAGEEGARRVAACGGDGTVHNVAEGLARADALDDVTFGVVPGGTGNDFAANVGVRSVEHAFELLETGERRRIDLGVADDELFTNSCIAGLTAQTSSQTSSDMKEQFGTLAYVAAGLKTVREFEPLHVELEAKNDAESQSTTWSGEALCILVGNARRFTDGGGQANVEDGLFEVTVVQDMPTSKMLTEAAVQQFIGRDTENVTQMTGSEFHVSGREGKDIEFSLDGEIREHRELTMHVRERALELVVGPDYEPAP
ncbi:diacylglycerol kinase catalytic region [Halogeometricum pallidum JCM 14848]|uniref:Diacylglycerol kinase catalytic region n=1 Tax=Halogeometricum pallidum JCM 14848 TaxID=1227487 RepID=M0D382_HALPD|nr:diacylglycerol kinase family protein [Halogeometricum pallidum]ELZ29981.1 diacylglycerol kinase catalytic region [Halogeometricum pallidum JCM 14848]